MKCKNNKEAESCVECMAKYHMPYRYCCLDECNEHGFCQGCVHGMNEKHDMVEENTDPEVVEEQLSEEATYKEKYEYLHKQFMRLVDTVNDGEVIVLSGSHDSPNYIRMLTDISVRKAKYFIKNSNRALVFEIGLILGLIMALAKMLLG